MKAGDKQTLREGLRMLAAQLAPRGNAWGNGERVVVFKLTEIEEVQREIVALTRILETSP